MNYLEKSTCLDIAYAIQQCAHLSQDPREPHRKAVKWIGRYLRKTKDKGLILWPDLTRVFDVNKDADFAGNFHPNESTEPDTDMSSCMMVVSSTGSQSLKPRLRCQIQNQK
jgi:hypothetical protein